LDVHREAMSDGRDKTMLDVRDKTMLDVRGKTMLDVRDKTTLDVGHKLCGMCAVDCDVTHQDVMLADRRFP
jgi:hypothetical protein